MFRVPTIGVNRLSGVTRPTVPLSVAATSNPSVYLHTISSSSILPTRSSSSLFLSIPSHRSFTSNQLLTFHRTNHLAQPPNEPRSAKDMSQREATTGNPSEAAARLTAAPLTGGNSGGGGSSGSSSSGGGSESGRSSGGFFKRSLDDYTLGAVLLANAWLYFIWSSSGGGGWKCNWSELTRLNSPTHQSMCKHFIASRTNVVEEGRWYTLFSHAFAHYRMDHFLSNMAVFLIVGRGVIKALGTRSFMPLYFFGAVSAAGATIVVEDLIKRRLPPPTQPGQKLPEVGLVGASGAVVAMATTWLLNYRGYKVTVPVGAKSFSIPMGVSGVFVAFGLVWVGGEVFGLVRRVYQPSVTYSGAVSNSAHVAAVCAGVAWYFFQLRTPAARKLAAQHQPFSTPASVTIANPTYKHKSGASSTGKGVSRASSTLLSKPPPSGKPPLKRSFTTYTRIVHTPYMIARPSPTPSGWTFMSSTQQTRRT